MITLKTEQEMLEFGQNLAKELIPPIAVELIGDVGSGKTTITRGIGLGLGITEDISSPSFTISRSYHFVDKDQKPKRLVHYDFYRLQDPGIMQEDLSENLSDTSTITVIEWADTVYNVLPENRLSIQILINDDGTRTIKQDFVDSVKFKEVSK